MLLLLVNLVANYVWEGYFQIVSKLPGMLLRKVAILWNLANINLM